MIEQPPAPEPSTVLSPLVNVEDPASLAAYLRATGHLNSAAPIRVQVLGGGVSNRTVLITGVDGGAWVIKQALEKLRTNIDWFSAPERILVEAAALKILQVLAPSGCTPALIFEDPQRFIIAMQAVPQPHENFKAALLQGHIDAERIAAFGRLLGTIHRRGWQRRAQIRTLFARRDFFETLRLEAYYAFSGQQVPPAAGFLNDLIERTRARQITFTHGDYSPKNVLLRPERIILLDHETSHFGDPAFDIGFAMTHLLSKAHHLPPWRASFVQAARLFWDEYRLACGDVPWAGELEPYAVRHTLGCLLARVAGRSRLEYMNAHERALQTEIVTRMMPHPPATLPALLEEFVAHLAASA